LVVHLDIFLPLPSCAPWKCHPCLPWEAYFRIQRCTLVCNVFHSPERKMQVLGMS